MSFCVGACFPKVYFLNVHFRKFNFQKRNFQKHLFQNYFFESVFSSSLFSKFVFSKNLLCVSKSTFFQIYCKMYKFLKGTFHQEINIASNHIWLFWAPSSKLLYPTHTISAQNMRFEENELVG